MAEYSLFRWQWRRRGNGWFHKTLGDDMCAATRQRGGKKKFSQNPPPMQGGALVAALRPRLQRSSALTETDGAHAD